MTSNISAWATLDTLELDIRSQYWPRAEGRVPPSSAYAYFSKIAMMWVYKASVTTLNKCFRILDMLATAATPQELRPQHLQSAWW